MKNISYLIILSLICSSCGLNKESIYVDKIIDGVNVRAYHITIPPKSNPYVIEKAAVFGAGQSEDSYLLASAQIIGSTSDGLVYVNDMMATKIHRFDRTGRYIDSFGQKGDGPGDLGRGFYEVFLDDNRLLIWDSAGRFRQFSTDGAFLSYIQAQVRIAGSTVPIGNQASPEFITVSERFTSPGKGVAEAPGRFTIRLIDAKLASFSTILDSTFVREMVWFDNFGVVVPYQACKVSSALAPYLPVAWAWGSEYRINFFSQTSEHKWAVQIPVEPTPISSELRELESSRLERRGATGVGRLISRLPRNLPYIGAMDWDDEGRLWVSDYVPVGIEKEEYHYNVFSINGEWLFDQNLPVIPDLIITNGFYKNTEDVIGNPIVQFYRLVPADQ